jgi:hypothetical protein
VTVPATVAPDPFVACAIDLRWLSSRNYQVLTRVVYQGARDLFIVDPGFITDLASVPRWVEWLIPRDGAWLLAALIHDLLCVDIWNAWREDREPRVSSRDADGILWRIMGELDASARARGDRRGRISRVHRHLIWCAVRASTATSRNPIRRKDWWRDAHWLIGTGLLVSPIVLPAALFIWIGLAVDWLARKVTDR